MCSKTVLEGVFERVSECVRVRQREVVLDTLCW